LGFYGLSAGFCEIFYEIEHGFCEIGKQ